MRSSFLFRTVVALAVLVCAAQAQAHEGHGMVTHFAAGLLHPFSGVDHLMAMLLVGVWCWARPAKAVWVPLVFMTGLMVGAGLGLNGSDSLLAERLIALSLMALGVMVWRMPQIQGRTWWLGLVAMAGFGLVHGHAHGVALQASASHLGLIGMVCASALLHATGWAVGKWAMPRHVHLRVFTAMASLGLGGWLFTGLAG